MCQHMYYKDETEYFPRLYCNIDDKICIYAKQCLKENKFVPNGNLWKECYKMIEDKIKQNIKTEGENIMSFDFIDEKYGNHSDIGYVAQQLKEIISICHL